MSHSSLTLIISNNVLKQRESFKDFQKVFQRSPAYICEFCIYLVR